MHGKSIRSDFEKLYIDYQPRLLAYARRFINDPAEAQDLVHDCFATLWDRHASLDAREASMMLFVMTRNRCLNYLKHKSIVNKYTLSYLARAKAGEERLYNYDFSFSENEHPYLYQELEQQIQRIMGSLPERCREVFILSRFQGLKNREIAERLHISLNTVERHIQRALRIFAEALEHEKSIYLQILILAWLAGPNC